MKYIARPQTVAFGPIRYSFAEFVQHIVNTDRRFNANGPGIRAGLRIEDAVKASNGVIELDKDLWLMLRDAAEGPSEGYPILASEDGRVRVTLARHCLPFIDAISGAQDEPPAVTVDETQPAPTN